MRCEICGKGPMDGTTVYRANEKGVKGIWRCAQHPTPQTFDIMHDPEGLAIENALNPPKTVRTQ